MEKEKVLIVEDDVNARQQLVKFVSKEGFEVIQAQDCAAALEIINTQRPVIVLTDYKMPNGDGLQVIRHARKTVPFCQAVLFTAFGELDTAIMALREGVLDYLKKPLDLDALALALGRAKEKINEQKKISPFPMLLIAEDDPGARKTLVQMLKKENWDILEAQDGEEALNLFKEARVDVALLDIKMPKRDGLSLLSEMKKIRSDFEAIMVTGYGDEEAVLNSLRSGAINFVKKPVDLEQLMLFLNKAMEELTLKRALKFRNRELTLANDVIARIVTREGIIMLDLLTSKKNASPNLALAILDLLPMGLALVTKEKEIPYVNKSIAAAMKGQIGKLDEAFVENLAGVGIRGLAFKDFMSVFNKIIEEEEGAVETMRVGQWAYITLVKLLLIRNDKREETVLMITRGERSA